MSESPVSATQKGNVIFEPSAAPLLRRVAVGDSPEPLISVITPTFNRRRILPEAIESLRAQTYCNWEHIIVDDGSTDGTDEAVRPHLNDRRVTYIYKAHENVSQARNAGLQACRGPLLAFLDSDNIMHPKLLETLERELRGQDESVCGVYCDYDLREEGRSVDAPQFDYSAGRLMKMPFIDLGTLLLRRRALEELGCFDPRMTRWVDFELILRLSERYELKRVPKTLLTYRRLDDGITKTVRRTGPNSTILANTRRRVLRLAYLLNDWPALSQTFVREELRWLRERGVDVKVVYAQKPDREARPDFDIEAALAKDAEEVARILARWRINMVHAHFIYPTTTLWALPTCELLSIPFTCIGHAVDIFHRANIGRTELDRIGRSEWCRRVLALGTFHRDFYVERGVPPSKVVINPPLPDMEFFLQKQRPPVERIERVVCIARFQEKKGIEYLIGAAGALRDLPVRFEIYGFGPLGEKFQELAADEPAVSIHAGPTSREQTREIMHRADLFALPCVTAANGDSDGLPMVLLEAMASGVPVVSTALASIPDLVRHDHTGFICRQRDSADLAAQIRRLARDEAELIGRVRAQALDLIRRRYVPEVVYSNLLRIWTQ